MFGTKISEIKPKEEPPEKVVEKMDGMAGQAT